MQVGEWIEHDGKGMPVDGATRVMLRWDDGDECEEGAEYESYYPANFWIDGYYSWNWKLQPNADAKIIAYRIVNP